MSWVESREGYKSNLVGDSGGFTIFGIASTWHAQDVAAMDKMSKDDARARAALIYLRDYWQPHKLDDRPWPIDLVMFDSWVQHAPSTMAKFIVGDPTWQTILLRRLAHYKAKTNGKWKDRGGWVNRIADLFTFIETQGV
jgi:hypothetical protein